jgi:hypothetical protein
VEGLKKRQKMSKPISKRDRAMVATARFVTFRSTWQGLRCEAGDFLVAVTPGQVRKDLFFAFGEAGRWFQAAECLIAEFDIIALLFSMVA